MAQRSLLAHPLQLLMVLALSLGLWGCGPAAAAPPSAVVEQAIAQRLTQTQTLFHGPAAGQPAARVGRVRIQAQHRITFDGGPAVEVLGTYRLAGGGLSAAQQRLDRDFDVYLQHRSTPDQWLVLQPSATAADGTLRWRATPLAPTAAAPDSPGKA